MNSSTYYEASLRIVNNICANQMLKISKSSNPQRIMSDPMILYILKFECDQFYHFNNIRKNWIVVKIQKSHSLVKSLQWYQWSGKSIHHFPQTFCYHLMCCFSFKHQHIAWQSCSIPWGNSAGYVTEFSGSGAAHQGCTEGKTLSRRVVQEL